MSQKGLGVGVLVLAGAAAVVASARSGSEPSSASSRSSVPKPWRLSPAGEDHLVQMEGFRSQPYNDSAGYCTVGIGQLLHKSPCRGNEPSVTEAQARAFMRQRTASAGDDLARLVKVPLSQGQIDSLISFVYNVGTPQFSSSTLLRRLNAGDYAGAAEELDRWVFSAGSRDQILVSRREAEKAIFLS